MKLKRIIASAAALAVALSTAVTAYAGTPYNGEAVKVGEALNSPTTVEAIEYDFDGYKSVFLEKQIGNMWWGRDEYRGELTVPWNLTNADEILLIINDPTPGPGDKELVDDDYLEYSIYAVKAGTYRITTNSNTQADGDATVSGYIDGKLVGTAAINRGEGWGASPQNYEFGTVYMDAGAHTFKWMAYTTPYVTSFEFTLIEEGAPAGSGDSSSSGSSSGSGGKDVPVTGASNSALPAALALLLSSACAIVLVRRPRAIAAKNK